MTDWYCRSKYGGFWFFNTVYTYKLKQVVHYVFVKIIIISMLYNMFEMRILNVKKNVKLLMLRLIDRFHDDFHTRSFSGLPFLMFQYWSYQNENFTIQLQMWSINMISFQIVEWFKILTLSDKIQLSALPNINKLPIIQQFEIKSCLSITFTAV